MIQTDESQTFEIEVNGTKMKFAYAFTDTFLRYDPRWDDRSTITFAVIRRIPASNKETFPIRDFVGQAVRSPYDRPDHELGRALAFRRACEKFYANSVATGPDWSLVPKKNGFWDLCCKARGEAEHTKAVEPSHHVLPTREFVVAQSIEVDEDW